MKNFLSRSEKRIIDEAHWTTHVGNELGIWVNSAGQSLYLIFDYQIISVYPCSTAEKGLGNRIDSNQTPPGWHIIGEKVGDALPEGAVFKSRKWTGKIWRPGDAEHEELILSRILWLSGIENGVNRGAPVDSYERYIYIHGTNYEDRIGQPVSKGCVRLTNTHVIDLFDRVELGVKVLIT